MKIVIKFCQCQDNANSLVGYFNLGHLVRHVNTFPEEQARFVQSQVMIDQIFIIWKTE